MLSIFIDCSKTIVENFKKFAEKGEPVEMKRYDEILGQKLVAFYFMNESFKLYYLKTVVPFYRDTTVDIFLIKKNYVFLNFEK